MKYAKKIKLVPYSIETPAVSQLTSTLNNALTKNTFSDEKVKIYYQALSKIKEINSENIPDIPVTDLEDKNYEVNDEINETAEKRKARIAKEIDTLEKQNLQNIASQTLTDYSNSDNLKSKKYRKKHKLNEEIIETILNDLPDNIFLTNKTLKNIDNYFNQPSYNNFQSKNNNLFSNRSNHYSTPLNKKVQFNLPEDNIPFFTVDNEFGYDQNTNLLKQNPYRSLRNEPEIIDDLDSTLYKSAINKTFRNPNEYPNDLSNTSRHSNNLSVTSKNTKKLSNSAIDIINKLPITS